MSESRTYTPEQVQSLLDTVKELLQLGPMRPGSSDRIRMSVPISRERIYRMIRIYEAITGEEMGPLDNLPPEDAKGLEPLDDLFEGISQPLDMVFSRILLEIFPLLQNPWRHTLTVIEKVPAWQKPDGELVKRPTLLEHSVTGNSVRDVLERMSRYLRWNEKDVGTTDQRDEEFHTGAFPPGYDKGWTPG